MYSVFSYHICEAHNRDANLSRKIASSSAPKKQLLCMCVCDGEWVSHPA